MMDLATGGLSIGLLFSALFFGLRHGIDWDHIAAITDITATQDGSRRGFKLGTVYVLGHAAVVFVLGVVIITIGSSLPPWVDQAMGRIVGWTLLILGAYVIVTLIRDRGEFRMRSRWMLLFAGVRRARRFVQARLGAGASRTVTHDHVHAAAGDVHHEGETAVAVDEGSRWRAPTHRHTHTHDLGDGDYSTAAVAGIGMLHGIGAETPTQLVIFLAAANAGGVTTGIAVLLAFIVGLVISNSAITVTAMLSFGATSGSRRFHTALGTATAALSVVVGTLFVLGAEGSLPVWFAG